MGQYWIDEPVTYQEGSKVRIHTRASKGPVKIDDAVAAKLGDKVRKVGGESEQPKTDDKPKGQQQPKQGDKQ